MAGDDQRDPNEDEPGAPSAGEVKSSRTLLGVPAPPALTLAERMAKLRPPRIGVTQLGLEPKPPTDASKDKAPDSKRVPPPRPSPSAESAARRASPMPFAVIPPAVPVDVRVSTPLEPLPLSSEVTEDKSEAIQEIEAIDAIEEDEAEVTDVGAPVPSQARQRTSGAGGYSMTGYSMTAERTRQSRPPIAIRDSDPGLAKAPEPKVAVARTSEPKTRTDVDGEGGLDGELSARAVRLQSEDPVGAARAWFERGLIAEWQRVDRDIAKDHYEAARSLVPGFHAALYRLRRIAQGKTASDEVAPIIDAELGLVDSDDLRADLHAMRGRAFLAVGKLERATTAFVDALKFQRNHPAALRWLEVVLRRALVLGDAKARAKDLADHLARMVEAFSPSTAPVPQDADAALAAWLSVERAELLEFDLADPRLALEALERGVQLEPNPGPVRAALTRHLERHDRGATLANELRLEADRESDNARASRLFYAAARVTSDRTPSTSEVTKLLAMGDGRAPQGTPTQSRLLEELVAALEVEGNFARVVEVRHKRLSLMSKPGEISFEYARLTDAYQRLGRPDVAADMAARSLQHDPAAEHLRQKHDQLLAALGRHAERVRMLLLEANGDRPIRQRIAACRKAADIAVRQLNQPMAAIDTLRAAWMLEPGNAGLFEDLASLLRKTPESDANEVQRAFGRIDLYVQAEGIEKDPHRKIALLEKIIGIYEDELGNPNRAIEFIDMVRKIEPHRRSAILALSRNARRARDAVRLTEALVEEANITKSEELSCRLLLEAAAASEMVPNGDKGPDRDRALVLVDKALERKPGDRDGLRAKVSILSQAGRFDDARAALLEIVRHHPDDALQTWLEIAELDENARKSADDAVSAYHEVARERPDHPLPRPALVRLLRKTKAYATLVAALTTLAEIETDPVKLLHVYVTRAEVEELCLDDDEAAIVSLEKADACAKTAFEADETPYDPLILESLERILSRRAKLNPSEAATAALTRLYARWLERKPLPSLDHTLRVELALALAKGSPSQAIDVLEALVRVVPGYVAALRKLEQLHRDRATYPALSTVLYGEAAAFSSRIARAGALWELVSLEDKVGPSTTLDALARITHEFPRDAAALDTVIRVAGKLVSTTGVPHPAMQGARAQLLAALHARRALSNDPLFLAACFLEEAMLCEKSDSDAERRVALDAYGDALGLWPDSFTAARGLERLSTRLSDAKGIVKSQLALARLVETPLVQAAHLVRAADLVLAQLKDERQALELYEGALARDPENRVAAQALGRLLKSDPRRLVERLQPALNLATQREQVILLGTQIGIATLEISGGKEELRPDFVPAIIAMQRVLAISPDDVAGRFLLARLYQAQRAWAEAQTTLQQIVQSTSDVKMRTAAFFQLVEIFDGPLENFEEARRSLEAILDMDPTSKPALTRLYQIATKHDDGVLIRSTLERLAENETDLAARTEYHLKLFSICEEAGDNAGMVRALVDAVVSLPSDLRAWGMLSRVYRTDSMDGAAAYARAVEQTIELAKARRRPIDPRWLLTLGLIEVHLLKRPTDGLGHIQAAAAASQIPEMRVALAQALLAVGRVKEAAILSREILTNDVETISRLAEPSQYSGIRGASIATTGTVLSAALACLDAALATDGRAEEHLPVEEVRACFIEIPPDRVNQLRIRRLEPEAPFANAYAGTEISRALVSDARTPVVDAAIAIMPIAAKALRFELSSLGVTSRERIGPRDVNVTRALADRIARALGVTEFELYLTPSWKGAMRVYPGDPPALVGHVSFSEFSEAEQVFGLGRLLMRIAVGMPWLDEIATDMADALILSAMRSVLPQFGAGELTPVREQAVQNVFPAMQRAIGRKQRRLLEDVAPAMVAGFDFRTISIAVRRSEYRTAYGLCGNLLSSIDYLKRFDAEIARANEVPRVLLTHPVTNELIRYALSAEAYAERRRIGTVWTPS